MRPNEALQARLVGRYNDPRLDGVGFSVFRPDNRHLPHDAATRLHLLMLCLLRSFPPHVGLVSLNRAGEHDVASIKGLP